MRVKCTPGMCAKCAYAGEISNSVHCDYMNKTGHSRIFRTGGFGRYKEDYEYGYCQVYKRRKGGKSLRHDNQKGFYQRTNDGSTKPES